MLIKHFGMYVRDIVLMDAIIIKLGFSCTYNEMEMWEGKKTNIRKYIYKGQKLELIQKDFTSLNSYHICFEGKVPRFMEDFNVIRGIPFDKDLILDFVYVGDSIYFEFARNKE